MKKLLNFFRQYWADFKEGLQWMHFIELYDNNLNEALRKREEQKKESE
jgi:hypothetical protein